MTEGHLARCELDNWLEGERRLVIPRRTVQFSENGAEFVVVAAMGTATAKQIDLLLTRDDLRVSVFEPGHLFRKIRVRFPKKVNAERADVQLKDGLLTLRVPIAEAALRIM